MILRWIRRVFISLLLITCFAALASVLHVRTALAGSALEYPATCLEPRDFDQENTLQISNSQKTQILVQQVRGHYLNSPPKIASTQWHARGAFAWLGLWLGYSSEEQGALAEDVIDRMEKCRSA